ncbi:MAG: hypothetical protein FWB86_03755 [Treponema sp.]|nr:hypothetical protein [Treponema sp.]MCL2251129.1 hypothetical protein [Treponema sp.]
MKSKMVWLGMLALMSVFGMAFIGCGLDNNTDPKSITITGITGNYDAVQIMIGNNEPIAMGMGLISNGSATVQLFNTSTNPICQCGGDCCNDIECDCINITDVIWTGNGSYMIEIMIGNLQSEDFKIICLYKWEVFPTTRYF